MTNQQTTDQPWTVQRRHEVSHILKQATYFTIFAVPDPSTLSVPTLLIPFIPFLIYEISIREAPRRFSSSVLPPTAQCGFRTSKSISAKQIAKQQLQLQVVPNNFASGPDRTPPPTLLIPFLSQRFWMHNGRFDFLDGEGSGFRLMAGGRFFPAPDGLGLYVGGVADIRSGVGPLEGLIGNVAINGLTRPPTQFANLFTFRIVDPEGKLATASLPPVEPEDPDPDYSQSAVISLMAELHPDDDIEIETLPQSHKKQIHLVERLRLVNTNFDVGPGLFKAHNVEGAMVGERRTTLVFDPDDALDTIPLYSINSEFRFFADGNKPVGTLKADLSEGRAFRTWAPELHNPYFRISGFGLYGEGTGQFTDVQGMLTMNGALSLTPGVLSSMYVLRLFDRQRRFRSLG